ncbi:MAG TPA: hypothetical protein VFK86_17340 [Bauldia sp.]|nr:hypothetical protein [Bauldia sp.]
MKIRAIAAVAGTAFALSMGSALAWDLHDTLAPASDPTPATNQSVSDGADLQIPGSGNVSVRGAVYDYQCADAKAKHGENSAEAATFC